MRLVMVLVAAVLSCIGLGCARPFKPAPNVEQVMKDVEPAARLIWGSVVIRVDADGVHEKVPKTDEEWGALRNAASTLAESGTLLGKETRASENSEWSRQSQSLVDAASATLQAVDSRNPDQILAIGEQIYNTCVGCHGRYSSMTAPP